MGVSTSSNVQGIDTLVSKLNILFSWYLENHILCLQHAKWDILAILLLCPYYISIFMVKFKSYVFPYFITHKYFINVFDTHLIVENLVVIPNILAQYYTTQRSTQITITQKILHNTKIRALHHFSRCCYVAYNL